jgi:hypothetical protein
VSPRPLSVVLAASFAAGSLLAGCTGNDGSSGSAAPSSSASAEDTPSGTAVADDQTAAPPFPANTEPDTGEPSADARVTVSDLRIGGHDGFDRVVLEVGGQGRPGWDVRYVDAAVSQGSGEPVDVAGDAVLQVTLTGVGLPADTGVQEFSSDGPVRAADTEVVTEAFIDSTFEGTTVAFVGTAARAPFRVYLLEAPTRVVLEVARPG